nr:transposase, MuDR [Tanacetum cinerariifolium]
MTNNISEAFNSWVGTFRYQPVLDLLDNIREKILKRLDMKRRIVRKWNGTLVPMAKSYLRSISKEICRSNDNHAEVKRNGKWWQVVLDERKCSCRIWQVKGLPCVHASAFISFTRDIWEKYCDSYFTIKKFKDAYAFGVVTMLGKDQWVRLETGEKIYPPIIKRPAGRPRKNRIIPADETKKGTNVINVVNLDIVKTHAKIHQLKISNLVKHPALKDHEERKQKVMKVLPPNWRRNKKN